MGWEGGHLIACNMIDSLNMWLDNPLLREGIYMDLIRSLRGEGWDDSDFFTEDVDFNEAIRCLEEDDE